MADFLDPMRLFPSDRETRRIAADLFGAIEDLPIVSPHGHTDPRWFAEDPAFGDAASLFLTPDHYVLRMLRSQGITYQALGVPSLSGEGPIAAPREAWRTFCAHYTLFDGTPSQLWINHALHWGFGIEERLSASNADAVFDAIGARLKDDDMRPRAILDKAKVEVIATTEFALDPLSHHATIADAGLAERVRTTYRPDDVTDPDHPDFLANLTRLAEMTGCDTHAWDGLIEAHRVRRAMFRRFGATATDHGVISAHTVDLAAEDKQNLLSRLVDGVPEPGDKALFRAQMLTEMAGLAVEDGMVMQIHAGSFRNTDRTLFETYGANMGADIPLPINPVRDLAALLDKYGNAEGFRLIFFSLDESNLSREVAPMAGYWPCLMIGPPWWFHDSPRGIARYLDAVVETAGFSNLAGFNDDTRALLSIPARHDVWRRCVAAFLADMVARHLLSKATAQEVAVWLATDAARAAYRLD
ncbi:MAG: glucuronate isomerase [Pseudomonadota bacterium]